MQGASDIPEPDYPYPVRYWWLKRILVSVFCLLASLIILRLIWGWDANRRLQQEISLIRMMKEPVLADEFATKGEIDNNQKAILDQAVLLTPGFHSSLDGMLVDAVDTPAQSKAIATFAEQSLTPHAPTLALLRKLILPTKVEWAYPISGQRSATSYAHLCDLLKTRSLVDHAQQNDFEAVESLRHSLALANALAAFPGLYGYLNGIRVQNELVQHVMFLAPRLQIDRDLRSATRNQIRALIDELLVPLEPKLAERAMQIERAEQIEHAKEISSASTLLAPMYLLDAVDIVRDMDLGVSAARTASWHEARSYLDRLMIPKLNRHQSYGNRLSELTGLGADAWLARGYASHFSKQAAAVTLAIWLYAHDHTGEFPPTLDALVPAYLSAVPIDPFSKEQRPIRYLLAEAGKRPILASVGENELPDVVTTSIVPAEPLRSGSSGIRDVDDYLFDIAGSRIVPN